MSLMGGSLWFQPQWTLGLSLGSSFGYKTFRSKLSNTIRKIQTADYELVRIVLVPQGAEAEAAAEGQIILDLKIDGDSRLTAGPLPAFGRRGAFSKVETLHPFTLMADGRVDYGAYAQDQDRQDNLDIRSRRIVVGETAIYKSAAGDRDYVIKSVTAHAG